MNTFWSKRICGLKPYTPGEQPRMDNLIKLNTNENPYPPSPAVIEALQNAANANLRLYPDPEGTALRQTIVEYYAGIHEQNVFVGNGSDEILALAFFALLQQQLPILFPDVTYSFYPVYCSLWGIEYREIPVNNVLQINIEDYYCANGGIIFPNPNAPTGNALERSKIRKLLENNRNSVVIVDEAYVDFGAQSAVGLIGEFPNLLVIQTLSKSRSLAGLRVGYAMGDAGLIEALHVVKDSFNSYPLDRLALAGAEAALRDNEYFEKTRKQIIQSREWLTKELVKLGFDVLPSRANFLFVQHSNHKAAELQQQLRDRKILVRHFARARIDNYLRITVGSESECAQLIKALQEITG